MKILITGGPVHANLDAVKIITNTFRGRLMAEMADLMKAKDRLRSQRDLSDFQGSQTAIGCCTPDMTVLYHDGFHDYMKQVLEMAPTYTRCRHSRSRCCQSDTNEPVGTGKFPSHNYKVGDKIPIDFTIAKRVIDEVKESRSQNPPLRFELSYLLSCRSTVITAAYGVLLESHATAVFANDAKSPLLTKSCVTKERGVHRMNMDDMATFIYQCLRDTYYRPKPRMGM